MEGAWDAAMSEATALAGLQEQIICEGRANAPFVRDPRGAHWADAPTYCAEDVSHAARADALIFSLSGVIIFRDETTALGARARARNNASNG